jgi:hypothetical protein
VNRAWIVAQGAFAYLIIVAGCGVNVPASSPMPRYAAAELERLSRQNEWIEQPEMTDEHKAIIRESLAHYRKFAETLPADPAGEALIKEAASYFDGDLIRVWMNCKDAVRECEDPSATQRDLLEGMAESLRCLKKKHLEKRLLRRFVVLYSDMRKDEHLTHRQAIDEFVNRRMLDNE